MFKNFLFLRNDPHCTATPPAWELCNRCTAMPEGLAVSKGSAIGKSQPAGDEGGMKQDDSIQLGLSKQDARRRGFHSDISYTLHNTRTSRTTLYYRGITQRSSYNSMTEGEKNLA